MNNYCNKCNGAILPNGSMGYAGLVCHCPYKVTVGNGGSDGSGGGGLSGIDYLIKRIESLEAEVICEERRFGELWEQFAALDKVNQELLEALKGMMDWEVRNIVFYSNPAHKRAEAAIAKATGEQA